MKKLLAFACSAALLACVSCSASAADPKIAVIDVQKILTTSPQVEAMRTKLKNQFSPKEKEIDAAKKNMQANIEKYKKDNAVMNETQKKEMQNKIMAQQTKLHDLETNFQQSLVAAQNQSMQNISKQIQDIVNKIAKDQGLDLILIKGAIAYSNPSFDVTDKVIDGLKKS